MSSLGDSADDVSSASSSSSSSAAAAVSSPMLLNPPDDFIVRPGDQLCVVATDQTPKSFRVRDAPARHNSMSTVPEPRPLRERKPNQQLLICNWRDDMEDVSPLPHTRARARMSRTLAYSHSCRRARCDATNGADRWLHTRTYVSEMLSCLRLLIHCHRFCMSWISELDQGQFSLSFRT